MASSQFNNFDFSPEDLYLNSNETDLLIAALDSNKPEQASSIVTSDDLTSFPPQSSSSYRPPNHDKQVSASTPSHGNAALEGNPYLDFDTSEGVWDWNLRALPEHLDGGVFESSAGMKDSADSEEEDEAEKQTSPDNDDEETGDKRKTSDDPDEDDGGGKRHETDPKNGKKQTQRPGRKPLTSEPTTKRKAQNRAAQRAFRERKEKHLKDLEVKVEELEKASESANHENSLLRAQVDRLQMELKEYRKRLSVTANTNGSSPTLGGVGQPFSSRANWDINNNFNFEFPKFGTVNNGRHGSVSANTFSKHDGNGTLASPVSISSHRSNSQSTADLSNLFTADVLSDAENRSQSSERLPPNPQRKQSSGQKNGRPSAGVMPRNSVDSNSASPASSGFNSGLTSSCATTPEVTCRTPDQRTDARASVRGAANDGKFESQGAFCKDFQTARGNTQNPVPLVMTDSSNEVPALTPALTSESQDSNVDLSGLDWLANQNGGVFDPILFADYREPQDNVMNNEFNFFNDAFPSLNEFSSPMNQPQTQPLETRLPKKKDLMQQIEDQQAGKEPEVVPGKERQQFLTCNLLWDRVQRSRKVQMGEADMDDLCTQLKAKAKCSGSGAVISQSDVDAILGPPARDNAEPDYLKMFR